MVEPRDNDLDHQAPETADFSTADQSGEVDLDLIDTLLSMTPAERLRWHADLMEFAERQRQLRAKEYGFDPADLRTAEEAQ